MSETPHSDHRSLARRFVAACERIYGKAIEVGDVDLASSIAENASEVSRANPDIWQDDADDEGSRP